jgi:hypothetical protein
MPRRKAPKPARPAERAPIDPAPKPASLLRRTLAYLLAAALLLSLSYPGIRAAASQVSAAIKEYRSKTEIVPPAVQAAAAHIRGKVPLGAPLFLVARDPDAWLHGIWLRALYPSPVFLVYSAQLGTDTYNRLRVQHRIRFAVSIGQPPLNPGFVWSEPVPGFGNNAQVVFGRLQ